MSDRACALCSHSKKKCDRKRPCKRCVSLGHECLERKAVGYSSRGRYSRSACLGCASAKVRCGEKRPCARCVRLGMYCHVPKPRISTQVTPYQTGSFLPTPSTESIFRNFHEFLGTVSPLSLADLLAGPDVAFRSALYGMCSVIPFERRGAFLGRVVRLAGLHISFPEDIGFISNRVQNLLEPEQASPMLLGDVAYAYHELDTLNDIKARIEYYLHGHEFSSFPLSVGPRPGVLVSTYIDPELVDGANVGLIGTLNPAAEAITGYTSAEYHNFQNIVTPDFSNFDGFPQILSVPQGRYTHIYGKRLACIPQPRHGGSIRSSSYPQKWAYCPCQMCQSRHSQV